MQHHSRLVGTVFFKSGAETRALIGSGQSPPRPPRLVGVSNSPDLFSTAISKRCAFYAYLYTWIRRLVGEGNKYFPPGEVEWTALRSGRFSPLKGEEQSEGFFSFFNTPKPEWNWMDPVERGMYYSHLRGLEGVRSLNTYHIQIRDRVLLLTGSTREQSSLSFLCLNWTKDLENACRLFIS